MDPDLKHIQGLEEALWKETTRFDKKFMEETLAQDFIEIGRSGKIYNREDVLLIPKQIIDAVLPLPDFKARTIQKNCVLIFYNSHVTYDGIIEYARRSSLWVLSEDKKWVIKFHQGTAYY